MVQYFHKLNQRYVDFLKKIAYINIKGGELYGFSKNWQIYCPDHEIKDLDNALIQRFEYSYKERNCELIGNQNAHYIFRKGKEPLTDRDVKKILKLICELGVDFQLEVNR